MQKTIRLVLWVVIFSGSYVVANSLKQPDRLDNIAEQFIVLAMQLDKFDQDYVDAYFGPKRLVKEAEEAPLNKQQLTIAIGRLYQDVQRYRPWNNLNRARHSALLKNIRAMHTRMRLVNGETISFRDEAQLIYDVKLPRYKLADFDKVLQQIDDLMGNPEDLSAAVEDYRNTLVVPEEMLKTVVETAIEECRLRTKQHIDLPEDERFLLEYVTDTSWGAYNWYQGENESLVQINTDFPMRIDRVVSQGCHEGYPGHHVWNVLVENELYKNGWLEFSLIPLFSPFALIAEGSAKYGVHLAFPGNDKLKFEQATLYPMAKLNPEEAAKLEELNRLTDQLSHASIAIAQLYLDGDVSRNEAISLRQKYSLVSRDRAEKGIRFAEQYRAYVVNYALGEDLLENYIERRAKSTKERWELFEELLTWLKTASDLK